MSVVAPEEELSSRTFSDAFFLSQFGGSLPTEFVLDYFALSPFWEKECINARSFGSDWVFGSDSFAGLKMQLTGQPPLSPQEFENRLRYIVVRIAVLSLPSFIPSDFRAMTGVQYAIHSVHTIKDALQQEHSVYCIRKQVRSFDCVCFAHASKAPLVSRRNYTHCPVLYFGSSGVSKSNPAGGCGLSDCTAWYSLPIHSLTTAQQKGLHFISNSLCEVSKFVEFDAVKDYDWFYSHPRAGSLPFSLLDSPHGVHSHIPEGFARCRK